MDTSARAHLCVPQSPKAHYARNFIKQAVCELRFPTLYELEGPRPPASFAHALRKDYPNHAVVESVTVGGPTPSRSNVHSFKSRQQHWTVNLTASSVVLETSQYDSFAEFKARLSHLVNAVGPIIDCDFFTRVGLRYINLLPYSRSGIRDWINPALVGALSDGVFGDALEHHGRVGGSINGGSYLLQHGLVAVLSGESKEYTLDFDFSSEDVTIDNTLDVVQNLHDQEHSLFEWALGPKAKLHLGPSDLKESR